LSSQADLFDDLPTEGGKVEIVVPETRIKRTPRKLWKNAREQELALRQLSNDIFEGNLYVLEEAAEWRNIEPGQKDPPKEWIEEHGEAEARRRYRIAQTAWLPAADAPVGLKLAREIVVGYEKARASEKSGPKTLNVSVVKMTAPLPQFPEHEVVDDDS
jgi:hypothetical protein